MIFDTHDREVGLPHISDMHTLSSVYPTVCFHKCRFRFNDYQTGIQGGSQQPIRGYQLYGKEGESTATLIPDECRIITNVHQKQGAVPKGHMNPSIGWCRFPSKEVLT